MALIIGFSSNSTLCVHHSHSFFVLSIVFIKWIAAEEARAGLRHTVVCPNVTGRTNERTAQSKRARAGSLALVDEPQVARTCILRAFGLQML